MTPPLIRIFSSPQKHHCHYYRVLTHRERLPAVLLESVQECSIKNKSIPHETNEEMVHVAIIILEVLYFSHSLNSAHRTLFELTKNPFAGVILGMISQCKRIHLKFNEYQKAFSHICSTPIEVSSPNEKVLLCVQNMVLQMLKDSPMINHLNQNQSIMSNYPKYGTFSAEADAEEDNDAANKPIKRRSAPLKAPPKRRILSIKDKEFNELCFGLTYDSLTPTQHERLEELKIHGKKLYETIVFRSEIMSREHDSTQDALHAHHEWIEEINEACDDEVNHHSGLEFLKEKNPKMPS